MCDFRAARQARLQRPYKELVIVDCYVRLYHLPCTVTAATILVERKARDALSLEQGRIRWLTGKNFGDAQRRDEVILLRPGQRSTNEKVGTEVPISHG